MSISDNSIVTSPINLYSIETRLGNNGYPTFWTELNMIY